MADTTSVECGSCGKRFRVRQDQLNRMVQCPHCRTATMVKGPPPAQTAADEMFGAPAKHGPQGAGQEKHLTSADIFGPGPLPPTHKSHIPGHGAQKPMARGAHGPGRGVAGRGPQAFDDKQSPQPRRKSNALPLIIFGAGAGIVIIFIIVLAVVKMGNTGGSAAPDTGTSSGSAALPVKTGASAAMDAEERAKKLLAKASTTQTAAATATDTVEATSEPPAAATSSAAAATATQPATKAVTAVVDDVGITVELVVGGFFGDRVTYVAGHVSNGTGKLIRALKITVPIVDRGSKQEIGKAVGTILSLGANQTAPYIAEWEHEEGVMGIKGTPTCQIDPPGSNQGLPAMKAESAYPFPDPNTMSASGHIDVVVTNLGVLPVPQVELIGVLLNKDGKIVGAAKGSVKAALAPNKPQPVTLRWTQCAGTKVDTAEVWAQAAP